MDEDYQKFVEETKQRLSNIGARNKAFMKGPVPKFIVNDNYIIDTATGATAEIYQDGESWLARNLTGADKLTEKRKEGLLKRMGEWYYHTQVKK